MEDADRQSHATEALPTAFSSGQDFLSDEESLSDEIYIVGLWSHTSCKGGCTGA